MPDYIKGELVEMDLRDLQPGTIIVAKSGRAQPTRKVYKAKWYYNEYHKEFFGEVWSIIVRWDNKTKQWEEECSLVSNSLERITHMIVPQEDGTFVRHQLKLTISDPDD